MTPEQTFQTLITAASRPDDVATIALAGVIAMKPLRQSPYDVAIAGLDRHVMDALKSWYFPDTNINFYTERASCNQTRQEDEFADLVKLLMDNCSVCDDQTFWLAHAIATASMSANHLWQDMGLPNRDMLSKLMSSYFTPLASRNTENMKWKKFFYRQLCALEGLTLCRSPSCSVCADKAQCFGSEEPSDDSYVLFSPKHS
jgi:nitrogen fixation protein NifQ